MAKKISKIIDIQKYDTEFQMLVRKLFYDKVNTSDNDTDTDTEELLYLLNAPEQYEFEDKMLVFAKENPDATLHEFVRYFDITCPDGLPLGDDGSDLLNEDD